MDSKDRDFSLIEDTVETQSKELEEVRNRLEFIMGFSSDGYWEIHCKDKIIHIDSRHYALIGYPSDKLEISLKDWEQRIYPTLRSKSQSLIKDLLSGWIKDVDFEYQFKKANGDYLWMRSIGKTVEYDVSGMPKKIIGITRNIQQQKNQEERNKLQNELHSLLLIPGSLETKLKAIATTVVNSIDIVCLEIWLKEESGENGMQFLYGSNMHLKRDFLDDNPLNQLLKQALTDPSHLFIFKPGEKVLEYFNNCSLLMVETLNFYSMKLVDSDGDILGMLNIFTENKIPLGILNFLLNIEKLAAQVIINDFSERKLREALQLTEKANRLMEGREVRIRHIKKEINDLTASMGWGAVYKENLVESEVEDLGVDDLNELRKNALSLAEDAEIARREAVDISTQLTIIKHAVNSSGDGIAISTVRGDLFYMNPAFEDLFGYGLEQFTVKSQEILYCDHSVYYKIMDTLKLEDSWHDEAIVISYSGRIFPVSLQISVIINEHDEVLGLIWIYSDITMQKRNEEIIQLDLREKKNLLRKAMILQQSFIQKSLPVLPELNVKALFLPCEQLGGDFFRIIEDEEKQKLVIILGDCTDHGIKASMDASLLTSLVEPLLPDLYKSCRTDLFLKTVSREYSKIADEDQFPTMFVLVVDYINGDLYYSSANSTIPYIIRDEEILPFERAAGMHIAYFESPEYERKILQFKSSDKILLFSDAILEIEVNDRITFGYGLMNSILKKHLHSHNDLFQLIIEDLKKANSGFPLIDDTTLILLDHMMDKQIDLIFHDLNEWKDQLEDIKGDLTRFDYTDREIIQLSIALDELCNNAYIHGNKSDKKLKVSVRGNISCDKSEFSITDEGMGFNTSEIQEQLYRENDKDILTPGWGISVAQSHVETFSINECGNGISILFRKKSREVLFEA